MAEFTLTTVVFHDGRRGRLYRFLVDFSLINLQTLYFFSINENNKSFALFLKKILFEKHLLT
jgi:hypothetical protein